MESTEEKILATLQDLVTQVARLETAVAGVTGKTRPQPKGISFESVGGKKIGHPVPVRVETEIEFGAIGGKCVRRAKDHPMFNAKPEERTQQDGETSQHKD